MNYQGSGRIEIGPDRGYLGNVTSIEFSEPPAADTAIEVEYSATVEIDLGTLAPHAYGRKYGTIKPHNLAVAIAASLYAEQPPCLT